MRKLILSSGHSDGKGESKDRGSSGNGYFEGDLTIEFADLLETELKLIGVTPLRDNKSNALSQTLNWIKGKFNANDVLIDIHWNASANTTANGSEVFISANPSAYERQLANAILNEFVIVGFKNRGVRKESESARKTLAWMRPNAENILIEVCFISNVSDMKIYQANKHRLAKNLAKAIKLYL